ncbi:MAG: hypothetical protein AB8E82_17140 [Aureispira sp.]
MTKTVLHLKHCCTILLILWLQLGTAQVDITIQKERPLHKRWAALNKILAKKRIVALGENFHGVREYNRIKPLLVQQYLHYLHNQL